ncbi:nitrate/nitrite two-component system sensor histidine kinase NarQ [Aliivibrio fischeri]|uniref:nitrate/nitrite two-component system sensor histidine kinase NarQ n=1 Tax=Aliivibrio fischeri TaxID=668 RepID=UPI001F318480|nr:nitrate/nitrite two-component system sensor histidine kinase NarQ [Aliivibrio fischeri]MCE7554527.1 nitrate/nitrite two-component system sensor histidine kinase NarQ [Aliivibrio fischeri]MCE7561795.1 nitrate/nitrite two-component system sensor histidine kinase NarQ [Aliivibrio fischeri]MCE7569203.1 nitrate/nitrite two-component system sensor histidine kinase NarQ [Aliivibrio fischeri]MCE7576739.1 nitrate/nitrite two-component system sensor histidine kinase NarQ [Aliivibrio fischeri]MCE75891
MKHNKTSILTRTIAQVMLLIVMISIITTSLALITLSSSLKDAEAVNIAGSLRMQSYRLAYDIETNSPELIEHLDKFSQSIESPSFKSLDQWFVPDDIEDYYEDIRLQWLSLQPSLLSDNKQIYLNKVSLFVDEIDHFVFRLQEFSERKLQLLSLIGALGLSLIVFSSIFIIFFTQRKIVSPLHHLVAASHAMTKGNYSVQVDLNSDNELGQLGNAFNHMTRQVDLSYRELENRVEDKTKKLSQANRSLMILYQCSQQLSASQLDEKAFKNILDTFTNIEGVISARLIVEEESGGDWEITSGEPDESPWSLQELCIDGEQLGYLLWQVSLPCPDQKLIINISNILARGIFYNQAQKQTHQLILLEERSTIARELHDSLAQSLSYLKIQTTLLKRQLEKCDCINTSTTLVELDEGLKSAYSQLRGLLNTFRLTINKAHFGEALQEIMTTLASQTKINIHLNNELPSLPINAQQHVHLLQLIREATLNAIKHSKADNIIITCFQEGEQGCINIEDDGVGFDPTEEKINHYGLRIMQERANCVHGKLSITSEMDNGCTVNVMFPLNQ